MRHTYVRTVQPSRKLAIFEIYSNAKLTEDYELGRIIAHPAGSSRMRWWIWPDGSWTAYSTSRIIAGPGHGKFLFQSFQWQPRKEQFKVGTPVYCSSMKTAREKAMRFGRRHGWTW